MNMFARSDENPAMTLQAIKETKCYRWTHKRTDRCRDNAKTVYPPQTKLGRGVYKNVRTDLLDTDNYIYNGLF